MTEIYLQNKIIADLFFWVTITDCDAIVATDGTKMDCGTIAFVPIKTLSLCMITIDSGVSTFQ
jgi:hypothetical protein